MRKSAKNKLFTFKTFLIMAETNKAEQELQVRPAKTDELFTLVKDKDGVKICVGNYQISRKVFKSWQNAEEYLNQKPYEILINIACLSVEKTLKQNENK